MKKNNINIDEILGKIQQASLKNKAVGLDIGQHSVKLVQLVREGATIRLTKLDSAEIPQSGEALLEQGQMLARVIEGLLAKNKVKSKALVLAVDGQSVFVKFLEILPMPADKLEKTIKYEVQQQIPFSLEEVEWDTHLFASGLSRESAYRVLLVAIKKDKLWEKKAIVEKLGLRPAIFDVSTLSIYNCLRFNQDYDAGKITLVLDIGGASTDLLILKGQDLWMRSFAFGADTIAESLKEGLNLQAILENLQAEIARSIEYYYFQQKQDSPASSEARNCIDEILLAGGAGEVSGLVEFLTASFSCPVRWVEPFKKISLDEGMKKELALKNPALFAQGVGLALRGLSQSCININLLKGQIAQKTQAHQRLMYGAGSLILSLLILFAASTFMRADYQQKGARLAKLKELLTTFSTYQPRIKELEERQDLFSHQINLLSSLALNRSLWLEAMLELKKMLPNDLWITELTGASVFELAQEAFQNKLDLQGKAASYDSVNDFVAKLKSSALFSEVKPLSSGLVEEQTLDKEKAEKVEVVKFSISAKVLPRN